MLKWSLALLALSVAGAALFNFVRAPNTMPAFYVTLAVGEFGHWLVLLPLGIGTLALIATDGVWRLGIGVLSLAGIVGLLRPAVTAKRQAPAAVSFAALYHRATSPKIISQAFDFARPAGVELRLDFYPVPGNRAAPCVVVIHGGGWDGGTRTELRDWNDLLVAHGYAVAAIDYRLAPQWTWPAAREDTLAAVAFLKANAAKLRIDPTRLVLFGRSAGGQIAAAVAYGASDPAVVGVVALYAPHDMQFVWSIAREDDALNSVKLMRQYFGGAPDTPARQALYDSASAQLLATKTSPPTLLIHGEPDTLVWHKHSERLTARLAELRVPHQFVSLPWATHAFDYNLNGPGGQIAQAEILRFLERVTR